MRALKVCIRSALLAALIVSGTPASAGDDGFDRWFVDTAHAAAADPLYRRIPLDDEVKSKAFVDVTHRLYLGEISADQFSAAVDEVYPGHAYEIAFLIKHLPQR